MSETMNFQSLVKCLVDNLPLQKDEMEVLGSFALKEFQPKRPMRPNDIDIFYLDTAINKHRIFDYIANVMKTCLFLKDVKVIKFNNGPKILELRVDLNWDSMRFSFIGVDKRYTIREILNNFDLTCSMFRMYYDENGVKHVEALNDAVRNLTLQNQAICFSSDEKSLDRVHKYRNRNFNIVLQERPIYKILGYLESEESKKYRVKTLWMIFRVVVKFKMLSKKVRYNMYIPGKRGFHLALNDFNKKCMVQHIYKN